MPTNAERQMFESRIAELRRWLRPAGQSVAEPVLGLLTAMPSQSGNGIDHAMRLTTFVEDLGDMPFFAVDAACKDFRLGRCGDGHWAPTAAEIRGRADHIAASYRVELADIGEVLEFAEDGLNSAPPTSAERVNELFRGLKAALSPDNSGHDAQKARVAADEYLEAIDPSKPLPKLSPAALGIFNSSKFDE